MDQRILPLPTSLLSAGAAYTRKSSSLSRHHLASKDFQTPAAEESGCGIPGMIASKNDYTVSDMSSNEQSTSPSPENGTTVEGRKGYCLCQAEPRIPRPRNVNSQPSLSNPEVSKIIGLEWRGLSKEEKDEWRLLAEEEKARHSQQHPDYRYRPRRPVKHSAEPVHPAGTDSSISESCAKCGGKTMVPPTQYTPHVPVTPAMPTVGTPTSAKRTYAQAIPQRTVNMVSLGTPIQNGPMYGFPPQSHVVQYAQPGYQVLAGPLTYVETHDAKRRRYNGGSAYGTQRSPGLEPEYERHPRDLSGGYPERMMLQSPQAVQHVNRPMYVTRSTPQQKQDPDLTLPPLRAATNIPKPTVSSSATTQKSGIEAMIMSYPVLTKLKTLSTIAPTLNTLANANHTAHGRGAIIAVEGMDAVTVRSMTESLADQLEKGGKFAVEVFKGPSPYGNCETTPTLGGGEASSMTTEKYLSMITEWHSISKEMIKYVSSGDEEKKGQEQSYRSDNAIEEIRRRSEGLQPSTGIQSPISVMSPRTVAKTADLSLNTPKDIFAFDREGLNVIPPKTPLAISEGKEKAQKITIAIIPHYQLTTVDLCSINIPIADNYDPITHWKWAATLFRSTCSPDLTIVLTSPHSDFEDEETPRSGSKPSLPASSASKPPAKTPFGVEVRLQEHRAVIVKHGGNAGGDGTGLGHEQSLEDNENWEKAKRRVAFEVEEFLRK